MLSDEKLLKQWTKHRGISENALDDQHQEASLSHAFFAGDQMAYTATVTDKSRRSMVVFNKIKPFVDSVVGFMVQLRRKPEYFPRVKDSQAQQQLSSYMNSLSDYARSDANMDQIETKQDREMLITGYGAVDTNIVYDMNPDGKIVSENVDHNDIFWDPQSREPNLLDSRWVFRRKKFSLDEAKLRFPDVDEGDFERYLDDQTNYVYNPQGGLYDKIAIGLGSSQENLIEVFYYQWWNLEKYYRAKNPLYEINDESLVNSLSQVMQGVIDFRGENSSKNNSEDYFEFDITSEYLVMTPSIERDLSVVFNRFGLDVEYQIHNKKVFYTALMTGETVIQKFRSLDQQGFTIKFKTADYDHENQRWFGMVQQLREPMKYSNKALTEILYVIASNSKGGVMYEEDAVEDPARFEQQWAITKAAIKLEPGAISGNKIAPKAQAALPNGYEQVHAIADRSIGDVTGVNKEFLGSSENKQVSAAMEAQRINQVVSTLAPLFDAITLFTKEQAKYMITLMRVLAENSEERSFRLTGDAGMSELVSLNSDYVNEDYDVDIGEAPTTPTQKQQTLDIMIALADKASLMGVNLYSMIVPYLPIKAGDKQKILQAMQPQQPTPEQMQAAQSAQQIQQEAALVDIARTRSDAILKDAQAKRTLAEVDETRADTVKTVEEARKAATENAVIESYPVNSVNVNI